MIFEFITEDKHTIRHNPSGMIFRVLLNPDAGEDYDAWNDTYQEFEFRGNNIICLMLNDEDYEPEPMPVGWQKIQAINRKAFKFFKSQVHIEKYEKPEGEWEDERYLLQQQSNGIDWLVTDKTHNIVILWKHKQFNKTQNFKMLSDVNISDNNFIEYARIAREATDWLVINHCNKV